MKVQQEANGWAQVLAGQIATMREGSTLTITTLGGEKIKAFAPITFGPNFIMCQLGPNDSFPSQMIPWDALGSIIV